MEHRHAWFKFQDERVVKGRLVVFHPEELNVAFVPTTLLSYTAVCSCRDHVITRDVTAGECHIIAAAY